MKYEISTGLSRASYVQGDIALCLLAPARRANPFPSSRTSESPLPILKHGFRAGQGHGDFHPSRSGPAGWRPRFLPSPA